MQEFLLFLMILCTFFAVWMVRKMQEQEHAEVKELIEQLRADLEAHRATKGVYHGDPPANALEAAARIADGNPTAS